MDKIDTADEVHHAPTGEDWVVAHVEGDRLAWCGWPPGLAQLSDCTLINKATPEERLELLKLIAKSDCPHRSPHAKRTLEIENVQS